MTMLPRFIVGDRVSRKADPFDRGTVREIVTDLRGQRWHRVDFDIGGCFPRLIDRQLCHTGEPSCRPLDGERLSILRVLARDACKAAAAEYVAVNRLRVSDRKRQALILRSYCEAHFSLALDAAREAFARGDNSAALASFRVVMAAAGVDAAREFATRNFWNFLQNPLADH